jgi:hypothetical protein
LLLPDEDELVDDGFEPEEDFESDEDEDDEDEDDEDDGFESDDALDDAEDDAGLLLDEEPRLSLR